MKNNCSIKEIIQKLSNICLKMFEIIFSFRQIFFRVFIDLSSISLIFGIRRFSAMLNRTSLRSLTDRGFFCLHKYFQMDLMEIFVNREIHIQTFKETVTNFGQNECSVLIYYEITGFVFK